MIGREVIYKVNGCVSTGKEVGRFIPSPSVQQLYSTLSPLYLVPLPNTQANVYHALAPSKAHLAVKIYKTPILVFKDRDRCVTGEYRFRRGYSKNPRKMVKPWRRRRGTYGGLTLPEYALHNKSGRFPHGKRPFQLLTLSGLVRRKQSYRLPYQFRTSANHNKAVGGEWRLEVSILWLSSTPACTCGRRLTGNSWCLVPTL